MMVLIGVGILVVALLVWLIRPRRGVSREAWEPEDRIEPIDHAALEAAEREVRGRLAPPEDEESGDDWGPGTT